MRPLIYDSQIKTRFLSHGKRMPDTRNSEQQFQFLLTNPRFTVIESELERQFRERFHRNLMNRLVAPEEISSRSIVDGRIQMNWSAPRI